MPKTIDRVRNFKIEIKEKRILRLMGYKGRSYEVHHAIEKLISVEKEKLDSLLQPASLFTVLDYEKTNKHPIFEYAEKVALCICTIGPKLEDEISKLMKRNELLRALILDALGSVAVEEVARQSDEFLAIKARKMNLWPSKRFSPGYKKWDIKEQRFVFSALPAEQIGVRLMKDSCMMIPRKSISFRINFYKDQKSSTRKQKI